MVTRTGLAFVFSLAGGTYQLFSYTLMAILVSSAYYYYSTVSLIQVLTSIIVFWASLNVWSTTGNYHRRVASSSIILAIAIGSFTNLVLIWLFPPSNGPAFQASLQAPLYAFLLPSPGPVLLAIGGLLGITATML
jgi:hypothetical protein